MTDLQIQQHYYNISSPPKDFAAAKPKNKATKKSTRKSPDRKSPRPPATMDPVEESEKLLRSIDIFLNVKNQNLTKGKNLNFEEYELRNQQKHISQHLVDLSSCLNNLIQRGETLHTQDVAQ